MQNGFLNSIKNSKIKFEENVLMKNRTTFKIGGAADVVLFPECAEELKKAVVICRDNNVPYFILGNGSNLLVSDKGIEGAVISTEKLNGIEVSENKIFCLAGTPLIKVCNKAKECSLSGLEFAYGIPGSVGGAFYMNAGAYGGEIKNVAFSALCVDGNGNFINIDAKDMDFGYRTSIFKQEDLIICAAVFELESGNTDDISEKMNEYMSKRKQKQPLEYPSAGSTFKRPEGNFAGALIEKNGLKGKSVGGAQVSEKHAGFIINKGNATASDVLSLIKEIQQTVLLNDGVTLETEVIFAGR